MPVEVISGEPDSNSLLFGGAGAIVLALALYGANYASNIASIGQAHIFDSSRINCGVRCFFVLLGYAGLCVGAAITIDHLPLADLDDVLVNLILAFCLMGLSNCTMVAARLMGAQGLGSMVKTAKARAGNAVRKGAARVARGKDVESGGAYRVNGLASAGPSTAVLSVVLLSVVGLIGGAVWTYTILAKNHSDYARFSFLVTYSVMVVAVLLSYSYMDNAAEFKFSNIKGKIPGHLARFALVFGGFFSVAFVQSIISLCGNTAL